MFLYRDISKTGGISNFYAGIRNFNIAKGVLGIDKKKKVVERVKVKEKNYAVDKKRKEFHGK